MTPWPKYESHKVVQAAKIISVSQETDRARWFIVDPGDGTAEPFQPTVPGMGDKAEVGDWAMLYPDGFKSISPAKAFEEGYTLVPGAQS